MFSNTRKKLVNLNLSSADFYYLSMSGKRSDVVGRSRLFSVSMSMTSLASVEKRKTTLQLLTIDSYNWRCERWMLMCRFHNIVGQAAYESVVLKLICFSYDSAIKQEQLKEYGVHASGNQNKWKHNGKRTYQCKQRLLALCHIRLVNDHGGHLVNQPCLKLIGKG